MRLETLLLSALPCAMAAQQLAYTPPAALMAKAQAVDDECVLPISFKIGNFSGKSNDTKSTLSSFNFEFSDVETKAKTLCHFNSTSKSTTPGSLTPRYPCEDGEAKFIWENDAMALTMVERVCPGPDG